MSQKSTWGRHINYHLEKAIYHLQQAIEHVPNSLDSVGEDPDGPIKDDVLGTAANVQMQVIACIDRFRKVPDPAPDPKEKPNAKEVAVGSERGESKGGVGGEELRPNAAAPLFG